MGHATLRKGRWAVTTYRVTCCYGGPEEGGWWYNWWQVHNVRTFATQAAAESACEKARKYLADMNGNAIGDSALGGQAGAARAEHAGRMSLVDHHPRVRPGLGAVHLRERAADADRRGVAAAVVSRGEGLRLFVFGFFLVIVVERVVEFFVRLVKFVSGNLFIQFAVLDSGVLS